MRARLLRLFSLTTLLLAGGCGSGESTSFGDPGADPARDASVDVATDASGSAGAGGAGGAGGSAGTSGAGGSGGSAGTGGAGGSATCVEAACQGHVYACGNCADDDADGLVDMQDPDCLGPCDDTEDGYFGGIPGQNKAPCKMDCYFDQDTGSGNDDCYWDHRCDPNEVAPSWYPESENGAQCAYDPSANVAGTARTCAELGNAQSAACGTYCGPLTPNGCDCFGCCELPAGQGSWVWLGSVDGAGNGTCDLAHVSDPSRCEPCTPVPACLNTCEHCELCLGKTELPADCYGAPDAGAGGDDGGGGSGGTDGGGGSGGTDGGGGSGGAGGACGQQVCAAGQQPCGQPCQAACPATYFCLTGCCIQAPR